MGRKKQEIQPESGIRLKCWLQDIKMTQKELGHRINYSSQYLSSVAQGKQGLGTDLAQRISDCPGIPWNQQVNPDWLLLRSDYEYKNQEFFLDITGRIGNLAETISVVMKLLKLSGYEFDFSVSKDGTKRFSPMVIKKDGCSIGQVNFAEFTRFSEYIRKQTKLQFEFYLEGLSDSELDKSNGSERNGEK